jgi:glycosyltransferase involved in cell wall biosynthesis
MIDRRITYCIPTKNNLRYLKNSINSIRENSSNEYDIVVFVDADNDDTVDWLNENGIRYTTNETDEPKGIAYGYNRCIEMAETPIVCMFHADMYMGRGFDIGILKYLKPLSVVSGTRIEPPLHPEGLEKIVKDFGMYPEDFKKEEFDTFVEQTITQKKNVITKGIFAPWAIYKEDITSIGMHDEYFHSYHEDSDIFNRFILNGYGIIQSWEAYVYHLTCRGGQFQDGVDKVTTDPAFHKMKNNAARNYLRKWGSWIQNDVYQHPILSPKYGISFSVKGANLDTLIMLEPWCDRLYVEDTMGVLLASYYEAEQKNTLFDLKKRVVTMDYNNPFDYEDIVVEFNWKDLTQQSLQIIQQLPHIIKDSGEVGKFNLDIFTITIQNMEDYQSKLINLTDGWYVDKLKK